MPFTGSEARTEYAEGWVGVLLVERGKEGQEVFAK